MIFQIQEIQDNDQDAIFFIDLNWLILNIKSSSL